MRLWVWTHTVWWCSNMSCNHCKRIQRHNHSSIVQTAPIRYIWLAIGAISTNCFCAAVNSCHTAEINASLSLQTANIYQWDDYSEVSYNQRSLSSGASSFSISSVFTASCAAIDATDKDCSWSTLIRCLHNNTCFKSVQRTRIKAYLQPVAIPLPQFIHLLWSKCHCCSILLSLLQNRMLTGNFHANFWRNSTWMCWWE